MEPAPQAYVATHTARPRAVWFAFNVLLLIAIVSSVFFFALSRSLYNWDWSAVWQYRKLYVQGWLVTVAISAAALVLSFIIGVLAALARRSPISILRFSAHTYVELVRGTPLLVQIFVLYYLLGDAFGLSDRYIAGILALSLFAGAYISEIVRSGIESVGASQLESARAVGFTSMQTYRYVIFPQAIRQMLPPLTGQFASLIKDSSLLSVISVSEFAFNAANTASNTYSTLESYLPLAAGYLLLTLPVSALSRTLESRLRYET
jgi:polar amino acid transport system permease protein